MITVKTYEIATALTSGVNAKQLKAQIEETASVENFYGLSQTTTTVEVLGDSLLDETSLDAVIAAHIPDTVTPYVAKTVQESKIFADDLMQRMKQKNILEGLSDLEQAAWVHHRLRKVPVTLSDETTVLEIDVMNLVISGDMETADMVLGQMIADDMTKTYHWLNQERIDWIRNEIRTYLGWPAV